MGVSINTRVSGQDKLKATGMYAGRDYKDLTAAQQYEVEMAYDRLPKQEVKPEQPSEPVTPVGATSDAPNGPQGSPSEGPQNTDGDAAAVPSSEEKVEHGQGD